MTKTTGQQIVKEYHKQFGLNLETYSFDNLSTMIDKALKQEYKRGWEDCYDHYQWGIKLSDPTA